jgi:hypothetical protein
MLALFILRAISTCPFGWQTMAFPHPPDVINPVFLSQHPFCHPISKTNLIKYRAG